MAVASRKHGPVPFRGTKGTVPPMNGYRKRMGVWERNVIRHTASTLLVMLSVAVGGTVTAERAAAEQAAAERAAPELIVDVDVNDEVWLRPGKMTEADVSDLVAKLKENGCQTLIVRCGCLGILPLPHRAVVPRRLRRRARAGESGSRHRQGSGSLHRPANRMDGTLRGGDSRLQPAGGLHSGMPRAGHEGYRLDRPFRRQLSRLPLKVSR